MLAHLVVHCCTPCSSLYMAGNSICHARRASAHKRYKQIIRAGLEDHFCGKLMGLPIGCDVCYTNHAEADQDDMDTLLTLLCTAGLTFLIGVPGADDIMLNYQSTSFHDALYLREVLGLRPAPEFEHWLQRMGIADAAGRLLEPSERQPLLQMAHSL